RAGRCPAHGRRVCVRLPEAPAGLSCCCRAKKGGLGRKVSRKYTISGMNEVAAYRPRSIRWRGVYVSRSLRESRSLTRPWALGLDVWLLVQLIQLIDQILSA